MQWTMQKASIHQILPGTETIAEKHVEDLLGIKAIPAKALGGACLALPTEACPFLVPIPVICRPVVGIAQTAESLGHSCKGKPKSEKTDY